ncbi:hypothetical protein Trydic_g9807 [Trypoxylus dichotomus]
MRGNGRGVQQNMRKFLRKVKNDKISRRKIGRQTTKDYGNVNHGNSRKIGFQKLIIDDEVWKWNEEKRELEKARNLSRRHGMELVQEKVYTMTVLVPNL